MTQSLRSTARLALAALLVMPSVCAQAMSCTPLSGSRFNFGTYDPLSVKPHDMQATYVIQCTPDYAGELLKLAVTLVPGEGEAGQWRMQGSSGMPVRFGLYRDPARQVPLDASARFEFSGQLSATQEFQVTIYGRLPARQNVAAGSYQATLTLLLEY